MIEALRGEAPGVSLVVAHLGPGQAMDALRRGEIDIAIGRFGAPPQGLMSERLFADGYCAVARRDHPTLRGEITEQQYHEAGHVFAHSPSEIGLEPGDSDARTVMTAAVPGWLTALILVASTDTIATCSERLARRHADLLGLQVLRPPFEMWRFDIHAVRRAAVDPGVDWLMGLARKAVD